MQMTCTACGWTGNRVEAKLVEPNKDTDEYPENPYLCGGCGEPVEPAREKQVVTAADVGVVDAATLLGKK